MTSPTSRHFQINSARVQEKNGNSSKHYKLHFIDLLSCFCLHALICPSLSSCTTIFMLQWIMGHIQTSGTSFHWQNVMVEHSSSVTVFLLCNSLLHSGILTFHHQQLGGHKCPGLIESWIFVRRCAKVYESVGEML